MHVKAAVSSPIVFRHPDPIHLKQGNTSRRHKGGGCHLKTSVQEPCSWRTQASSGWSASLLTDVMAR
jgi:hypothetical protein